MHWGVPTRRGNNFRASPERYAPQYGAFCAKADGYWAGELQDAPVVWTNLVRFVFRVPHYKTYPEEFADYEKRTGKPAPQRR